jgi:uncharacterized Zn finger protein
MAGDVIRLNVDTEYFLECPSCGHGFWSLHVLNGDHENWYMACQNCGTKYVKELLLDDQRDWPGAG